METKNETRMDRIAKVAITACVGLLLGSCGRGAAPPQPRQLVSINVQPGSAQAIAPDGTIPFSATGTFDQAPTSQGNLVVQWTSSDTTIADVDPNTGIATCAAVGGPVAITGSADGKGGKVSGSAQLTCQLSPNPVLKLDTSGVGVVCEHGEVPQDCACIYTPGKTVTVTNVGGASLDISNVAMSNGAQGFSQTNTCSSSLDTGQSCQIDVLFTPQHQAGTYRDDVVTTDNAAGSPHFLSLLANSTCSIP